MKRAVPDRLYTLAHPLEAFLLRLTRSTACRVLDVHGFGVTNVLSRTPHDPYIIWSIISLRNPWTFWTCKTVGPFNLNRGQDLSLPSVKPTDAFSASTSSTDVGHMRGINRPVRGSVSTGSAPTSPTRVTGHCRAPPRQSSLPETLVVRLAHAKRVAAAVAEGCLPIPRPVFVFHMNPRIGQAVISIPVPVNYYSRFYSEKE